ncbi:3-hydroxyacyl-ACP dehydratase [Aurantibacillus circumpalustris]|uniref:3-hydroxyacyl-ACP dehydratase n=1 Tax=Aurantibacillus circumpalustris TaxID=3036359 RepID=UPI00295B8282|nr:3-hydroxyacyl-ACP dehydratase [Aurantibacillus circumpalustris]
MEALLVSKEHITEYIPQGHPMVMIDTLNYCEGTTTKTTFKVDEGNIFVKNGILHEPGIIENIAQTAAVKAGYEVKKHGLAPLLGFIGAVKDLKIHALPKVGDVLETTVVIKADVMGVTLIEGSSVCNGTIIADCEMKIFIQKPSETNA